MGTKPESSEYTVHNADSGPIDSVQELSLPDFKQILTARRNYMIPPTVARKTAATILANFSIRLS